MQTPIDPLVAELVNRLNPDLREAYDERAGILEYEANLPREHAECLALINVLVSHPEAVKQIFERKNHHLM